MNQRDASDARVRFATTRWSLIIERQQDPTSAGRDGLMQLVLAYWYPLYAYVRRRGTAREDAEDLTQGFFAQMLASDMLRQASPERGRFRNFLLASLRNYMSNEWRARTAGKRGGSAAAVFDFDAGEQRYLQESIDYETPQQLYERRWALTLMENALSRVAVLYRRTGKEKLFLELKSYLASGDGASLSHVAEKLALSEAATRVALHRLRKRCRDALRAEVVRTIESNEDLGAEIAALARWLS